MWLMIAYKRQKCQNKIKQKKEKFKKPKTWAGFCKFSFSQSPSKKKRSSNFRHKKDIRQARNSKTQ
ncbi:hypothetical protein B9N60_05610 [Campylobacter concisus]|uniref:Uncharacterized protein n=1 Tax=Campylobacter concisus TaxID=199 RepID=A0A1Y5NCW0_9BACT|nr:hypothetical protein B9N60_05610 [Campylobacter concisus]